MTSTSVMGSGCHVKGFCGGRQSRALRKRAGAPLATPDFAPRLHMGKPRACLRGLRSPPCPLSALPVGWQASFCPA
ncbi:hypothetical protein CBM2617_B60086 [Cupriavidus taiwanensis]|nr:hypothetical protein CBM2617_B60086 [Cupriavidus taiwanensis]